LRAAPCDIGGDHPDLHEQAADEIERLRTALERIAEGCDLSNEAQAIAREALDDE
jgi:hypothetical protein